MASVTFQLTPEDLLLLASGEVPLFLENEAKHILTTSLYTTLKGPKECTKAHCECDK